MPMRKMRKNFNKRVSHKSNVNKLTKTNLRGGNNGRYVMPQSYFGNGSNGYFPSGSSALNSSSNQHAVSQGVLSSNGKFAGPNLYPMPGGERSCSDKRNMKQTNNSNNSRMHGGYNKDDSEDEDEDEDDSDSDIDSDDEDEDNSDDEDEDKDNKTRINMNDVGVASDKLSVLDVSKDNMQPATPIKNQPTQPSYNIKGLKLNYIKLAHKSKSKSKTKSIPKHKHNSKALTKRKSLSGHKAKSKALTKRKSLSGHKAKSKNKLLHKNKNKSNSLTKQKSHQKYISSISHKSLQKNKSSLNRKNSNKHKSLLNRKNSNKHKSLTKHKSL
jgi:hypothetical protein